MGQWELQILLFEGLYVKKFSTVHRVILRFVTMSVLIRITIVAYLKIYIPSFCTEISPLFRNSSICLFYLNFWRRLNIKTNIFGDVTPCSLVHLPILRNSVIFFRGSYKTSFLSSVQHCRTVKLKVISITVYISKFM